MNNNKSTITMPEVVMSVDEYEYLKGKAKMMDCIRNDLERLKGILLKSPPHFNPVEPFMNNPFNTLSPTIKDITDHLDDILNATQIVYWVKGLFIDKIPEIINKEVYRSYCFRCDNNQSKIQL